MRVLVAGASGAIGVPVVRLLRNAGDDVVAICQTAAQGAELAAGGAGGAGGTVPVQADVLDPRNLTQVLGGLRVDAVIALHTSPEAAAVRNLLSVARELGALRFVAQSTVLGYGLGDSSGHVHTEGEPFGLPGYGRSGAYLAYLAAVRVCEEQVLRSRDLDGMALRYGLLYGPGPASDAMVAGLRARQLSVTRDSAPMPWVFIGDAAAATVAALRLGERGAAYNVTDDEPVSMAAMLTAMARAVGATRPQVVPGRMLAGSPLARAIMAGGLRVSNARAKAELAWMPRAPTWRDGLRVAAQHYR